MSLPRATAAARGNPEMPGQGSMISAGWVAWAPPDHIVKV